MWVPAAKNVVKDAVKEAAVSGNRYAILATDEELLGGSQGFRRRAVQA
jgi:hypothetical protein